MARTGKYYSEYNRLLRNLRQRIYRAHKTGLEYSEEIIPPKSKRAPSKRELARLNKSLNEFNEKVYFVSPVTAEVTFGRKQAREAQRKELTQDELTRGVVSEESRQGETPRGGASEEHIGGVSKIPSGGLSKTPSGGLSEGSPQYEPTEPVSASDILYTRLYDAIDALEYITSEQLAIMGRTPQYRDKIYDIQAELLNAIRTPTDELYYTVQENYDELVDEATTALRYAENYSQAIDAFMRILGKNPTIEDTAWVSDTGDSYESTN